MFRDGLIELPEPRHKMPGNYRLMITPDTDPQPELICRVNEIVELRIVVVSRDPMLRQWNEYIGRYHYLGYKLLPGAQIRYFIMGGDRVLGAMGFGAAAWQVAARDNFIGWSQEQRKAGLHLIVGQSRFLILPWIRCHNLASKSLALVAERLPADWELLYGFRPVLLETFVDTTRFSGTCYKASNWRNVGFTRGRGKLEKIHKKITPVKSVWLRPLASDFRQRLMCGS
jgi:hypothetical protein